MQADQVAIEEINHVLVIRPQLHRLDAMTAPEFRDLVAPRLQDQRLVAFFAARTTSDRST